MDPFKELYLHVKDVISGIATIKHYEYWNNNVANSDDVRPYAKPAVFFNYNSIQWPTGTLMGSFEDCTDEAPIQYCEAQFTLHVIVDKKSAIQIDYDELNQFDIVNTVREKVKYTFTNSLIGYIEIIEELDDFNNTTMRDWQMIFSARLAIKGKTQLVEFNQSGTLDTVTVTGNDITAENH